MTVLQADSVAADKGASTVIINACFHHAQAVYLVGEFNGWNLDHPMQPTYGDRWQTKMPGPMPKGDVCFMVIDKGQTLGHLVYRERTNTPELCLTI